MNLWESHQIIPGGIKICGYSSRKVLTREELKRLDAGLTNSHGSDRSAREIISSARSIFRASRYPINSGILLTEVRYEKY